LKSLQRFAGATLAGLMMALASAPAARADSMLFGLDFGQTDLLDDVGDFWQDVTDGVSIRLGVGTSVAPRFEGSDSYKVRVMPKFAIRYENLIYLKNNRLRVFAIHSEKFVAGAQAKYEFGRDEDASPDLMGLGNVGDSLEMGGFIEWQPGWAVIGVEFGQDVAGGHNGFMASAYAGSRLPLGAGWSLAGGVQATWASENYMERNYGVSAEQSVASGLPEFDAKSGLKHVAGRIGLRFDRWKHWRFDSYVAYARLMSDAANNPLVELRGSPNQFIWAISGQYQF
jgi:outer membrane scaffolding protein for murein synthesis (MipA/OmpV family)